MFSFAPSRPRRRPGLTAMIDVVFLLLIFFMLASRFGQTGAVPLQISASGSGGAWVGPPRLIEIDADGQRLNGMPLPAEALADGLAPLMAAPTDAVVLRPVGEATLQRLVSVIEALRDAGLTTLIVAE